MTKTHACIATIVAVSFLQSYVVGAEDTAGTNPPTVLESRFGILTEAADGSLEFHDTFEIPLTQGTVYGWGVRLSDAAEVTAWTETYILPASDGKENKKLTNTLEGTPVEGWIGNAWVVEANDPPGKYVIQVSVAGAVVKEFEFHVKGGQSPSTALPTAPLAPPSSRWHVYEETSIDGTISGALKNGSILKTVTGNIYEIVDYVYLYEYEYNPEVLVLQDGNRFKLIIEGIDDALVCRKLNETARSGDGPPPDVIESYIVSEFDGFEYGNIYKLDNGQVWEQTEAWIWVWIWVRPKVLIYRTGTGYMMKVEQIEHPVTVRRLT